MTILVGSSIMGLQSPTQIGVKMLVELSVREMELIRNLIAEKQLARPLTFDCLTDEEECKVAVMLKLFVALEDVAEVLAH
jgi:hypothetical protein